MRDTKKAGFTTIEVLIAIAIIGFMLAPLLVMQSNSLESVARMSTSLDRIFLAKSFLHQARRVTSQQAQNPLPQSSQGQNAQAGHEGDQRFSFTSEELDPITHLIYERAPVQKNSSLAGIPGLMVEKIDAIGTREIGGRRKATERLISFVYVPAIMVVQERL